jgi:hypothetical protein
MFGIGETIQVDPEACGPQNEKSVIVLYEMPSLSWEMIPEIEEMRSSCPLIFCCWLPC